MLYKEEADILKEELDSIQNTKYALFKYDPSKITIPLGGDATIRVTHEGVTIVK